MQYNSLIKMNFISFCGVFIFTIILQFLGGNALDFRIVNGSDAEDGQFKYIASLQKDKEHFCAGGIIKPKVLLSAAHCFVAPVESMQAVVGTTTLSDDSGQRIDVESLLPHEAFNPHSLTNDVGLVFLKEEIEFNDLVQALPITDRPMVDDRTLTFAGWGRTSYPGNLADHLQWMTMYSWTNKTCQELSGNDLTAKFCTLKSKGYGICSGDSGGPIVDDREEIVGVACAAYLCARGLPDVFTDIYLQRDWIEEHSG